MCVCMHVCVRMNGSPGVVGNPVFLNAATCQPDLLHDACTGGIAAQHTGQPPRLFCVLALSLAPLLAGVSQTPAERPSV